MHDSIGYFRQWVKGRGRHRRLVSGALTVLLAAGWVAPSLADSGEPDGPPTYAAFRAREVGDLERRVTSLAQAHPKDGPLAAFIARVEVLDTLSSEVVRQFQHVRTAALAQLLDEVGVSPVTRRTLRPGEDGNAPQTLWAQYAAQLEGRLTAPSVKSDDLDLLRQYYDRTARLSDAYLARHGRALAATSEESRLELSKLCLVVPFSHVPDQRWGPEHLEQLPSWVRTPGNLERLEQFCLYEQRPMTAYHLASLGRRLAGHGELEQAEYFQTAADRLIEAQAYRPAVQALTVGIGVIAREEAGQGVAGLRLRLAQLLEKIGHHDLAAEQVRLAMEGNQATEDRSAQAVQYLKHLHAAEQFEKLIEEAERLRNDPLAEPHLPQILYVSWAAHRRLGHEVQAEAVRKQFLRQFPRHPLAADIHFAQAMTALAASDYVEAQQLVDIVLDQFPQSRLVPKAKQIKDRLQASINDVGGQ